MKQQLTALVLLCTMITSCASLGGKTMYKSPERVPVKNIGFTRLDGDSIVSRIFPKTPAIFRNTVVETLGSLPVAEVKAVDEELSIATVDTARIARICREHNLDGLIVSKLMFIHVTYSMNFAPIAQNYDTEVMMKLFDRNGKLLLAVKHNTYKGNSYMMPPTADRTIHDGTAGAVKRLAKEYGLEGKTSSL